MENQIGIFLKHDKYFFHNPSKPIRVCVMLDATKLVPTQIQITSKYGFWTQHITVETPENTFTKCHSLEHCSSICTEMEECNMLEKQEKVCQ